MPEPQYEDMIQRAIDGLTIIKTKFPSADVGVHSHFICVPDSADTDTFSTAQEESLMTLGWVSSHEFGWLFPIFG